MDGGVVDRDALLPADESQPVVEAGRVAGGEELLRVGVVATEATHLLGHGELLVENAATRPDPTVAAVTRRNGVRRVEHRHVFPLEFVFSDRDR